MIYGIAQVLKNKIISFMINQKYPSKGFTLIEAMLTITIMGIMLILCYPTYNNHLAKTKRMKVITTLLNGAVNMEKFQILHHNYQTATEKDIFRETTIDDYQLQIISSDHTYQLKALLINNNQANDCKELTLDHLGNRSPIECWK